jgi:hypothetical protein
MATGASRAVADTQYLQKKGNVWMVVVEVPKPLRPILADAAPEAVPPDLQSR